MANRQGKNPLGPYQIPQPANGYCVEMVQAENGEWFERNVYPSLAEFCNLGKYESGDKRVISREFTPIPDESRFYVVEVQWQAPRPDQLGASDFEAESKEMKRGYSIASQRFEKHRRPRSWVDVPRGLAGWGDGLIMDEAERPVSRAKALDMIAAQNRAIYDNPGERKVLRDWFVALEFAQPIRYPRGMFSFCANGMGSLETTTITPVRLMRPTADELKAYAIKKPARPK